MTRRARTKTCFANQRTVESAVVVWGVGNAEPVAVLVGVVNASSPLVSLRYLKKPPRCPAAPTPTNSADPTPAEGAYSLDANGNVVPCVFGDPEHGSFVN